MKTQTTNSRMRCPLAAVRYARILYDLGIPGEQVQKTREIFEEVPQLHDIFVNPTIALGKKMSVIDRVFPEEIRNFLKVVCKYQRMDLIPEIFTAYDDYCDEQNNVLNAALTCSRDEKLLGGFILRVGSDEYDWSIKGRLNRLEQRLK